MTHYPDLDTCTYFPWREPVMLAVGWLDREHGYTKGTVRDEFVRSLFALLMGPWQPGVFAGYHRCQFCVLSGGPCSFELGSTSVLVGGNNVFVPSNKALYVAPSMILHYMDAHEYSPPEEFQEAVLACPPMRTMDYLKAIRRHGLSHVLGARL